MVSVDYFPEEFCLVDVDKADRTTKSSCKCSSWRSRHKGKHGISISQKSLLVRHRFRNDVTVKNRVTKTQKCIFSFERTTSCIILVRFHSVEAVGPSVGC